jgi:hypothetical protein
MKRLATLSFLFLATFSQAQIDEQIYYKSGTTGHLSSINDSVALIFRMAHYEFEEQVACTYRFSNDTLYMKEIAGNMVLKKRKKYAHLRLKMGEDSLMLTYHLYEAGPGPDEYDTLDLELDGVRYTTTPEYYGNRVIVKRPRKGKHTLTVYSKGEVVDRLKLKIDGYDNVVDVTVSIASSTFGDYGGGGDPALHEDVVSMIPERVEIDDV